ncbi:MAG: hypothetical protein D6693_00020 [Planctomycetota bacterium]|nr:MAG: hypothetical protein D6693_00020 [Planctomycetota bacterium]
MPTNTARSTIGRAGRRPAARLLTRLSALLLTLAALAPTPALRAQDAPAAAPAGAPIPASRRAQRVAVITIEGPIDRWTSISVRRRLEFAEREGYDAVVFDLDTPGGEVGAVLEITNAIKGSSIANTVAWVNPDAYSGGAIIALSCSAIVVNDPATMGDAAPIAVSPFSGLQNLGAVERQKILAPLIAELVDSARRNGYDELLVQAFVATGVELWMVEDLKTGRRLFVDEQEYRLLFDGDPPRSRVDLSAADQPPVAGAGADPATGAGSGVRLALPDASPQLEQEVSESLDFKGSETRRPAISGADKGRYRLIGYATDGGLLTLKSRDLIRYGFASRVVKDDRALERFFGASSLTRLDETWSEALARFLDSLVVKGLLIVVFLLALFMEMAAPGIGLPGGVALAALAILVAPQFLVGAAAWWGLVAILGGLGLIALEIFVIPGFGVPGVAGIVMLFLGLLGVIVGPGGFTGPGATEDIAYALATLLLSLSTAGVGMYFLSKHYRSLPIFNRLVLADTVGRPADGRGEMLAAMAPEAAGPVAVGAVGVATTPLRPAGTAEFDDRLIDVVSEFGFIDAGQPVRVTSVGRFRVAVEPADGGPERLA